MDVLYVVVPCYNEQDILKECSNTLKKKIKTLIKNKMISNKSKILFVNDGSKDNTLNIIKELNDKDKIFKGISLSRNRGHQNALLAGLLYCKDLCDFTISIDADLQDDVNAIDEMVEKYNSGSDIVYGVRNKRYKDSFFKRTTAICFYKFLEKMGANSVFNHADFRLLSKKVVVELSKYKEVNLYLRGIIPMIGFNSSIVYYDREERTKGETKYTVKKMFNFAFDGITSLSITPIHTILFFGIFMLILSLLILVVTICLKLFYHNISIYIILFEILLLFISLNTVFIGIIGEYLGKISLDVKQRPKYVISEIIE